VLALPPLLPGIAGYRDLGALQIGNRTYFGRFTDGPLESPFAGNLIDICPTGCSPISPPGLRAGGGF